jgi:predicted NBD/HSP70 family sugar kinase
LSELGAAFELGDAVAVAVVEETAQYLARGLVGVIWCFDPEFILLTGPVVRDCPGLIGATRKNVENLHAARRFNVPLILEAEQAGTGVVAASAIVSLRYLEDLAATDSVPGGRVLTAV